MSAALNSSTDDTRSTQNAKCCVIFNLYDACAALYKRAAPAGHHFNIASFHTSDYCFKYEHASHFEHQMYKN